MTEQGLARDSAAGRRTLATVTLGSGIAILDGSVVNVALRRIGTELDASLAQLQWVVNGYLLALASLILIAGSLPPRGRLVCVEANPLLAGLVRSNVEIAGLGRRVRVVAGDALRAIPLQPGRFDFALIDAAKADYLDYLRQLEPKLVPGAVVVADNTGVFRREVKPYLDWVRDPAGRYTSREHAVGDDAMEVSTLRR